MEPSSMETEILNNDSAVAGPQPIVKFNNAYKRYGRTAVILRGLNMTIPTGTIYGLLGPSGCGKTTLLSCIVGRRKLDSGTLFVDVKSKVDVGYMPQEVSLYEEFQIHEVFRYFGLLTNQTEDYIKHREKELAELLDLPPTNRLVCNLSGGQQRRVSMAVALFHNPKFLILDEPTVGLDPLLCESIWKYFIEITNVDHKTIIITTHYIEEARNAHTIGLMRSGILLAETSPLQLMEMNNCSSLEEAFLTLSQKQEDIPSDDVCSSFTIHMIVFQLHSALTLIGTFMMKMKMKKFFDALHRQCHLKFLQCTTHSHIRPTLQLQNKQTFLNQVRKWHGIDSLLKFTKTFHGLGEIYRKEKPSVLIVII